MNSPKEYMSPHPVFAGKYKGVFFIANHALSVYCNLLFSHGYRIMLVVKKDERMVFTTYNQGHPHIAFVCILQCISLIVSVKRFEH
jgi:hypothetical protein